MRHVVTKEDKVTNDKRPTPVRARGTRARACPCGQQLDICGRAHCPRCGRTLSR